MSVGVMTVGVMIVGVMTVGVMRRPLFFMLIVRERPFNLKGGLWFFSKKIF
jgi:hypothetical protein